jgi:hypothetical protein
MRKTPHMGGLEAARTQAGLPGKETVCFFIAPLIPTHRAGLAGGAPGQQPAMA